MDDEPDDDDELNDLDDEFSLDQLSRAYAEVMREKNPQAKEESEGEQPGGHHPATDSHGTTDEDAVEVSTTVSAAEIDLAENKADNANCPLTPESIIEAMLFVGTPKGIPFQISQLTAELRDVSEAEALSHFSDLNKKYKQEKSAFHIVVEDKTVRMALVEELNELQAEFYGRNKQVQLSQAAIDVLSVVAYNQPITREQLETSRGKPSGSVLAQLVRRNLLSLDMEEPKAAKRNYTTTDRFLELFQLSTIDDLPQSHDVSEFEEYIDD